MYINDLTEIVVRSHIDSLLKINYLKEIEVLLKDEYLYYNLLLFLKHRLEVEQEDLNDELYKRYPDLHGRHISDEKAYYQQRVNTIAHKEFKQAENTIYSAYHFIIEWLDITIDKRFRKYESEGIDPEKAEEFISKSKPYKTQRDDGDWSVIKVDKNKSEFINLMKKLVDDKIIELNHYQLYKLISISIDGIDIKEIINSLKLDSSSEENISEAQIIKPIKIARFKKAKVGKYFNSIYYNCLSHYKKEEIAEYLSDIFNTKKSLIKKVKTTRS